MQKRGDIVRITDHNGTFVKGLIKEVRSLGLSIKQEGEGGKIYGAIFERCSVCPEDQPSQENQGGYVVPKDVTDKIVKGEGPTDWPSVSVSAPVETNTAKDWLRRVKEQKDFIQAQNETLAKILEDRPILELDGKRLAMLTDKGNVRMLNTELMTVKQAEALADWIKQLFPDKKGV